jgi:hypothetical protein
MSWFLAALCLAVGLVFSAFVGGLFFPARYRLTRTVFGAIAALSVFAVLGTTVYLAGLFSRLTVLAILLVMVVALWAWRRRAKPSVGGGEAPAEAAVPPSGWRRLLLAGVVVGDLLLIVFFLLVRSPDPMQSPWIAVPLIAFGLFAVVTWMLLMALDDGWGWPTVAVMSLHGAVLFGVSEIIYAYGFGFDPFIHRAAEDYIAAHGLILPRQPFYNGQYILVVAAQWLTGLKVDLLDRLLVPALAALTLPVFSMEMAAGLGLGKERRGWLPLVFALVAFLPLTFTTPNNLVVLMLIWVVCLLPSVAASWSHQALALTIAAAAVATHPLVGFVALVVAVAPRLVARFRWRAALGLFLASALALPGFFVLNNLRNGAPPVVGGNPFDRLELFLGLFRNPNPILMGGGLDRWSFIYAYQTALPWLLVALAVAGSIWLWRRRSVLPLVVWPVAAGITVAVFVMSTEIWVPGVIGWEQGEFSARLLDAAQRLIVVLWAPALAVLVSRFAPRTSFPRRAAALAVIALLATAAWYLTYPQANPHSLNVGWGVGRQHWETVELIKEKAGAQPYLVLSDQMVSVAALRRFGFENLPYAIPTGGRLYEYYLDMAHGRVSRAVMEEAMAEFKVNRAFFVVNDYYGNYDFYLQELAPQADAVWYVDGGRAAILDFSR